MSADTHRSRLRWLCRRGMKELDLLMLSYLDTHYASATAAHREAFERLLEMADPELHGLLTGRYETEDKDVTAVVETIRRTLQPDQ